jgi:hypothetical protein
LDNLGPLDPTQPMIIGSMIHSMAEVATCSQPCPPSLPDVLDA